MSLVGVGRRLHCLPQGNNELSEVVRKVTKKLSQNVQEEMSRVVNLSIQVNETAIFSTHMLSNLKKVDHVAQAIAAAAEEMVATLQSISSFGGNISKQA